jgi:hypothetical protein
MLEPMYIASVVPLRGTQEPFGGDKEKPSKAMVFD